MPSFRLLGGSCRGRAGRWLAIAGLATVGAASLSCDAGVRPADVTPETTPLTCHLAAQRVSNRGDLSLLDTPPSLAVRDPGAAVAWVGDTQNPEILLAITSNADDGFAEDSATAVLADIPQSGVEWVNLLPSTTGFTLIWSRYDVGAGSSATYVQPLDSAGLAAGAAVAAGPLPGAIAAIAAAADGVALLLSPSLGAITFARINVAGEVIVGAALAADATSASVTAAGDGFAAAWAAKGDSQLHFARLDGVGNLAGAPVIIGSTPLDGWAASARVLSSNDHYQIVWSVERPNALATTHFTRLDGSGSFVGAELAWLGAPAGISSTATEIGVLSWDGPGASSALRFTRVDAGGSLAGRGVVPLDPAAIGGFGLSFAGANGGFRLAWSDLRTDGAMKIVSCGSRPCSQYWGEAGTQPPPPEAVTTTYIPQVFSGRLTCD
jgi:hypothetical protein